VSSYVLSIVVALIVIFESSNSLLRISVQQHFEDRLSIWAKIRFDRNFFLNDIPDHLLLVVPIIMWRSPTKHFIHQGSETPPVHLKTMTFSKDNFWCQVLRSSTEWKCLLIWLKPMLRKSKICDSNMPFRIEQDIFWFEIPIYDSVLVEVADSLDQLSCVYLSPLLAELRFLPKISK
jgi:hypothetical protein